MNGFRESLTSDFRLKPKQIGTINIMTNQIYFVMKMKRTFYSMVSVTIILIITVVSTFASVINL